MNHNEPPTTTTTVPEKPSLTINLSSTSPDVADEIATEASSLSIVPTPMAKKARESSILFKKALTYSPDLFQNRPELNLTKLQSDG